jgi:hypothetical protein
MHCIYMFECKIAQIPERQNSKLKTGKQKKNALIKI